MTARAQSRARWWILPILTATLTGCPSPDSQLAPRTNWYIQDVPVPEGFERNQQESNYSADVSGRRILDVYEGRAHPIRVRNFYLTNLPSSGWVKKSDTLAGGIYTLEFSKAKERCTVTIGPKASSRWSPPTEARVSIETRSSDGAFDGRDAAPNDHQAPARGKRPS